MVSEDYLQRLKTPCSFDLVYESKPRLVRCPWQGVVKLATYSGRLEPGTGPRPWGDRDGNLIRHQGKLYLELGDVVERCVEFLDEEGTPISVEEISQYVRASHRGEQVSVRSFQISKIAAIRAV